MSHGKRTGPGNVKNGQPYVGWASMAAAQFALRFHARAQRFDQRKRAKSTHTTILARQAVAHQLARACYDLMRALVSCAARQAFG